MAGNPDYKRILILSAREIVAKIYIRANKIEYPVLIHSRIDFIGFKGARAKLILLPGASTHKNYGSVVREAAKRKIRVEEITEIPTLPNKAGE